MQGYVTLPNYQINRTVGSGAFGFVFEAWDSTQNRKVALKRIEKVGQQLSREYEILTALKENKYIVQLLDFYYSKSQNNQLVQNMVFEFMEDNLEDMVQRYAKDEQNFTFDQIKSYSYQILKGLEFMHEKNIAHRDLKPENILINDNKHIKICDFGSSKVIDTTGKNTPYIVSRYYRAPELILCLTNYTTAIDIWATGAILAELILLDPLFQGQSEGDQLFAIFRVLGSPSTEEMESYSKKVPFDPKLFEQFPSYNSNENIFNKIYQKIQNEDFIDLLKKMFAYLPEERITAKEALQHKFFAGYSE